MSNWTHPICDDDWDELYPDRPSPRTGEGDIEHCCWCGRHTMSGIYLREDPNDIPGHEDHRRDS